VVIVGRSLVLATAAWFGFSGIIVFATSGHYVQSFLCARAGMVFATSGHHIYVKRSFVWSLAQPIPYYSVTFLAKRKRVCTCWMATVVRVWCLPRQDIIFIM